MSKLKESFLLKLFVAGGDFLKKGVLTPLSVYKGSVYNDLVYNGSVHKFIGSKVKVWVITLGFMTSKHFPLSLHLLVSLFFYSFVLISFVPCES